MGRLGTCALAICAAALSLSTSVHAAGPVDPRLAAVESWAFAIGNGSLEGDIAGRYEGYDLVVVDAQEARRRQVRALGERGAVVLGYLSVGTVERFRPWYRRLKPYRLEANRDWRGEFFAEVRAPGYRRQIAGQIAPRLLDKGFDGLFLDNVDMIEDHRRQSVGMERLVARLGRLVRGEAGLLFAQNGFEVIDPFLRHLDGWNREDVSTAYDFDRDRYRARSPRAIARIQDELRAVTESGLLVTATDYTKRRRGALVQRAIANACAAGAVPYVSDIELSRVPSRPLACG